MSHLVWRCIFLVWTSLTLTTLSAEAQNQFIAIVIVRHQETDKADRGKPVEPLSEAGRARAALLPDTLQDVQFTHMFASHTTRSREAIADVAAKQKLPIVQLPAPGSLLDGEAVNDQTSRRAPIEPISKALLALPAGSVALVGLNSENIYAILNKLGVPLAPDGSSCAIGSICVPCDSNKCFSASDFDRVWYIVHDPARVEPVALFQFRYGAGWKAAH